MTDSRCSDDLLTNNSYQLPNYVSVFINSGKMAKQAMVSLFLLTAKLFII